MKKKEDYPSGLIISLWGLVKTITLEWIKTNKPQAWFRPMFEN